MFMTSPLETRNQLGTLIQATPGSVAVEVGTHRGDYARIFMTKWPGELVCVDPWSIPEGYEYQSRFLWGGADDREDDLKETRRQLEDYILERRVWIYRGTSEQCALNYEDETVDLVYLDGDHRYEHVLADLNRWWPKLKPGGILAGHDIICPGEEDGGWGQQVQPAVIKFAIENSLKVCLITEPNCLPWSFHMTKG